MAAGLGFKDFTTGEVLTAGDVDGYLMQGVWVFASAAARDAAVTSPQEGNFAYLKDTNVTTYYTGSAWANLDTTGMTNPMTTTGDTIYSSSGSTPARLGIGSTGNVLTVAGGVPTWAAPAGGGAGNIVEIATGSLSGASVSLTGLSSYTDLYLMINAPTNATASGRMYFRINSNSGSNYVQTNNTIPASGSYYNYGIYTSNEGWLAGTNSIERTDAQGAMYVSFHNCKNAGFTNYDSHTGYLTSPGGIFSAEIASGIYKVSESVSSIQFYNAGGNFNGGTYALWGA
jgi:hypothetical protein